MKVIILILMLSVITGCGSNDAKLTAVQAVSNNCAGHVTVTVELGSWGNAFIVSCNNYTGKFEK